MSELVAARVRVPCSTSNLGSGFDTLGVALDRYLEASFEPGGRDFEVERTGTLETLDESVDTDHVATVFIEQLRREGVVPRGLLRLDSQIPVGRGLGSSAAAFVAAYDLARAVRGADPDVEAAFRFACAREGHGDNAAPCALGGLRAVVPGTAGPRPLLLPLSGDVAFAYAAPAAEISTSQARAALPHHVAHGVAVSALGRIVALTKGLADGDPELIRIGIADELHVPHRLPLIPGAVDAMGAGYEAGAWAVTISGSGSGLISLCALDSAGAVAAAMRAVFEAEDGRGGCVSLALRPDFAGVTRGGSSSHGTR